jgi:CO dehydrogenase maturation factor
MLRKFLDGLGSQYKYVVIDNEAGMEHLSRRTTNNVDMLCIVAEPTAVGEVTARRIFNLARKLPITVKRISVAWSRSDQNKELDGIDVLGHIPYDQAVCDAATQGKTVFDLEDNSPAFAAARNILEEMMVLNP